MKSQSKVERLGVFMQVQLALGVTRGEIPDIVTRVWRAHQVLVQVTVVPVEWVTKVVSLV